jgi:hypothetical protein
MNVGVEVRSKVTELVPGVTLGERMKRGAISAPEAPGIAWQITEAMEAVREKDIVHRDLKPANVEVTPDGNVKAPDFALARALENAPAGSIPPTRLCAVLRQARPASRLLLLWLIALALHAGSAAAQLASQSTIVDRQSGVAFPVALIPPGGGAPHRLTGTATRERTIFRLKVYAYGLYVNAGAARTVLAAFVGRPAAALESDQTFFQRLLDMRIPMTLRLVMTRDVAGEAIGNAFDDALKPRVARAATNSNKGDGSAALERFRSYFNLHELARGAEIVFSCSSGGRLNTTVDHQSRPEIQSPALCWALFDVYLGDRPISTDGRRSLVSSFPTLLAGSK